MAKCAVCGKSVQFGHNVSHSHKKTNRMWKPNIKHVICKVNGVPKRLYVCTSCRSGMFKERKSRKSIVFSKTGQSEGNTLSKVFPFLFAAAWKSSAPTIRFGYREESAPQCKPCLHRLDAPPLLHRLFYAFLHLRQ